jgi:hypothetical protein
MPAIALVTKQPSGCLWTREIAGMARSYSFR